MSQIFKKLIFLVFLEIIFTDGKNFFEWLFLIFIYLERRRSHRTRRSSPSVPLWYSLLKWKVLLLFDVLICAIVRNNSANMLFFYKNRIAYCNGSIVRICTIVYCPPRAPYYNDSGIHFIRKNPWSGCTKYYWPLKQLFIKILIAINTHRWKWNRGVEIILILLYFQLPGEI